MAAFKSKTAQEVWQTHWCERCYRNGDCDILRKALRTNKKPKEWERNPRAQTMADQVKCTAFSRRPPRIPKGEKQFEDVPMFDIPDEPVHFVPVEGWPERPTKDGVDHA